jgi:hypothetical protein
VPLIELSDDLGKVVRQVGVACKLHNIFVVNHGIDKELQGESCGYASSFTSLLLWKETLSFCNALSSSGCSTFQGRHWLQLRATATIQFDDRLRRGGGDLG